MKEGVCMCVYMCFFSLLQLYIKSPSGPSLLCFYPLPISLCPSYTLAHSYSPVHYSCFGCNLISQYTRHNTISLSPSLTQAHTRTSMSLIFGGETDDAVVQSLTNSLNTGVPPPLCLQGAQTALTP